MLADPIFQGLAISLMAGEVASLLLSRMAVPVLFYLSERKKHPEPTIVPAGPTVLAATDFSPQSAIALRFAERIAGALGARLRVVNSHEPDLPPYFTESQMEELAAREAEGAAIQIEAINAFARETGVSDSFDAVFVEDSPVAAILEEAEKSDLLMIALGTHGRGGLEKLRFGSVASAVLREAECPVLTVGVNVEPERKAEISRIICAVDDSPASNEAVRFAVDVAVRLGSQLSVVRVGPADKTNDANVCGWIPEETRKNCSLREITRDGDLVTRVIEVANTENADLIIVGVTHKTFADSTLETSPASLIGKAKCPVVTVPEGVRLEFSILEVK
jgi:nucleotide-binding universal stress UspA family protein